MPIAAGTAAGIAAGSAILSAGTQAYTAGKSNLKTRRLIRQQYDQQKRDNLENWHRQNEYNSPVAEVERLKAAGLNPALAYGSSAGAGGQASPVQSTKHASYTPQTPDYGKPIAAIIPSILQMADLEHKEAVTSNTREQGNLLKQEGLIRDLQLSEGLFGFDQKQKMSEISQQYKRNQLLQQTQAIDIAQRKDIRDQLQAGANLEKILTDNKLTNSKIETDKVLRALYEKEKELAEQGIGKNTPWYARMMYEVIKAQATNLKKIPALIGLGKDSPFKN